MGAMCTKSDAATGGSAKSSGSAGDAERTPAQKRYPYNWPVGADQVGYLTERQVKARLKCQSESTVDLGDGYTFRWAAASQRGYYPSQADKANQDAFAVHPEFGGPKKHWFAVYDGHGPVGEKCSGFACEHVAKEFTKLVKEGKPVQKAMAEAHVRTNRMLAASAAIDDQQSGTTAITMYMDGRKVLVSNVGDSRVMLGTTDASGKLVAKALSTDQTPYRRDERERVKAYGARVMTADQIDGVEPIHENWDCKLGDEIDDGGDPPRIWAQDQEYPGTAFTRSIGDSLAESLGVVAEPELDTHTVSGGDRVLIAASDGIFEFITTKECVETALLYADPLEACKALVGESYKLWIEREDRTDDITIILGYIEGPGSKRGGVAMGEIDVNIPHSKPTQHSPEKKGKTRRGSLGVNK